MVVVRAGGWHWGHWKTSALVLDMAWVTGPAWDFSTSSPSFEIVFPHNMEDIEQSDVYVEEASPIASFPRGSGENGSFL